MGRKILTLEPEFKEIFNKLYTRNNENDWNPTGCYQKPVETFGYDSVLFIDDNIAERNRLKNIYKDNQISSPVDITYFSGFSFGDQIDLIELIKYMELAKQDGSLYLKLQELLNTVRNESGCNMMCSVIDTFMSKEFKHGLTIEDENYRQEHELFTDSRDDIMDEFENIEQLLLSRLVQTANDTQARLDEAKKLEQAYIDATPKKAVDGQEI